MMAQERPGTMAQECQQEILAIQARTSDRILAITNERARQQGMVLLQNTTRQIAATRDSIRNGEPVVGCDPAWENRRRIDPEFFEVEMQAYAAMLRMKDARDNWQLLEATMQFSMIALQAMHLHHAAPSPHRAAAYRPMAELLIRASQFLFSRGRNSDDHQLVLGAMPDPDAVKASIPREIEANTDVIGLIEFTENNGQLVVRDSPRVTENNGQLVVRDFPRVL
jgi:hypothetical protein